MKIPGNLSRITPVQVPDLPSSQHKPEGTQEKSFGKTLTELLYAVNDKGIQANKQVDQVVRGESDDLHTAMVALEEANISFQLMLETRNKMLEAYQEINRMNI